MGQIFVISGADFSRKNLGKVVIPRNDLNEVTKLILEKFSGVISDDTKYKFDNFVTTLVSKNIWDKLISLNLPILASSKEEACQDVIGNYPIGGIDIESVTFDSNKRCLNTLNFNTTYDIHVNLQNIAIGFYCITTNDITRNLDKKNTIICGGSSSCIFRFVGSPITNYKNLKAVSLNGKINGVRIISNYGATDITKMHGMQGGILATETPNVVEEGINESSSTIMLNWGRADENYISFMSSYLTADEVSIIGKAITELVE